MNRADFFDAVRAVAEREHVPVKEILYDGQKHVVTVKVDRGTFQAAKDRLARCLVDEVVPLVVLLVVEEES